MNDLNYFERMVMDGRVFIIETKDRVLGYALFSICNDINPYCQKDMFEFKDHDPDGKIVFIELLVGKGLDSFIRHLFADFISKNYKADKVVWVRSIKGKGKLVTASVNRYAGHKDTVIQSF